MSDASHGPNRQWPEASPNTFFLLPGAAELDLFSGGVTTLPMLRQILLDHNAPAID